MLLRLWEVRYQLDILELLENQFEEVDEVELVQILALGHLLLQSLAARLRHALQLDNKQVKVSDILLSLDLLLDLFPCVAADHAPYHAAGNDSHDREAKRHKAKHTQDDDPEELALVPSVVVPRRN